MGDRGGDLWSVEVDPPHQLVVGSRQTPTSGPRVRFVAEPGSAPVRREWDEREVVVSLWLAGALRLAEGDTVVERSMRVFVGAEPVLTSNSYLPVGLTGNAEGWRDVEAGHLAVAGLPTRSTYLEERSRMPTSAEAEALGIDRGTPVLVLAHPYELRAVPAGVLVVARSDRVYLRHEPR